MSRGGSTREAILQHGVEGAYRVGLGGLTIGDLATATGMSKSGLYAHFRSKEALQLAVLAQAREEFTAAVIRPALAVPRGEPRIRELFERWVRCGLDRSAGGCLFVKASTELDEQAGPVRDQLARDHLDLYETIATVVRGGVAAGQFRADVDPVQFAADLDGVMLAFYHWYRLLDDDLAQTRARRAFEALLRAARDEPHVRNP